MPSIDALYTLLNDEPNSSFIHFALAQTLAQSGAIDKAIDHYNFIIENDPNYIGVYYHLANLYKEKNDLLKAMATVQMGINIANQGNDHHSLSELKNLKLQFEIEAL